MKHRFVIEAVLLYLTENNSNQALKRDMNYRIDKSKGWAETIIDSNCDFSKFEKVASLMKSTLKIVFTQQLNDPDNSYFDFEYSNSNLCLHYNFYLGISIFPTRLQNANETDNDNVIKITNALIVLL